ncbi:MAG: ATP-dependent RecD-like DNA helicase, partial [bacterium]|nr:ATP-dependent RecD-like DNA helicase [bacterium]
MNKTEGSVLRVVFRNAENGYTVLKLIEQSTGLNVTAVGVMPEVHPDMRLRLQGNWTKHPRYGAQFQVARCEIVPPTTEDGIEAYLASGLIREVGPVSARLIVEAFGTDTLRVLDEEPERLQEISGIGPARAAIIVEAWREHRSISELMMFLQGHGISTGLSLKIHRAYGSDAHLLVQKNPYRLTEIVGVGFAKADQVARAMGFARDAPERVRAGVIHTLRARSKAGDVYVPRDELIESASLLLGVSASLVEDAITALEGASRSRGKIHVEDVGGETVVYPAVFYDAEVGVTRCLRLLTVTGSPIRDRAIENWKSLLSRITRDAVVALSPEQQRAVHTALTHKASVLTGGPGTGKTVTVRAVIAALEALNCRYALCAPTGRAAKRLSEITGRSAETVHRLLGYTPEGGFQHDEDNPLTVDFVVVDEASMLDLRLTHSLLDAVDLPAHVLLVGDVNQLPSVGAGNVLRDMISSDYVAVSHLTTIFRQAAGSGIVVNAHRINRGEFPICNDGFGDFYFFTAQDPQAAIDLVVDIVQHRIPQKFGLSPDEIQVLAPMYRGDCGITALNAHLQEALNPPSRAKAERKLANCVFRVGDRVMQTRNDYDKMVFNGDVGLITAIDVITKKLFVEISGSRVTYLWNEATEHLTHAFAMSIHKSQGSE